MQQVTDDRDEDGYPETGPVPELPPAPADRDEAERLARERAEIERGHAWPFPVSR